MIPVIPDYLNRLAMLAPQAPQDTTPPYPNVAVPPANNPDAVPKISAPMIKPTVSAAPVDPNSMPFHKKFSDLVVPVSTDPQFQDSKFRRIMTAIAGGLAGAAGHPEIGGQLHNMKYNAAFNDYLNQAQHYAPLMKSEDTGLGLGVKQDVSNAGNLNKVNIASAGNFLKSDIANQKTEMGGRRENRLFVHESNMEDLGKETNRIRQEEVDRKIKKDEKGGSEATPVKNFKAIQGLIKTVMDDNPGMSEENARKLIGNNLGLASPYNPFNSEARMAQTTLAAVDRKKQEEQVAIDVKNDPENVKKEVATKKALETAKIGTLDPTILENYAKSGDKSNFVANLDPKSKAAMFKVPGYDPPKKLNAQEQLQFDNGKVALNHVDTLREYLKDPFIQSHLGAIAGRISLVKQTIGGKQYDTYVVKGKPVSGDRREQEFLTFAAQLLNWEVKNVAGNRPAHQLFDRLAKTAPGAIKSLESNLGSLNAIEKSITNTMDGYQGIIHKDNKENIPKKSFMDDIQEVGVRGTK